MASTTETLGRYEILSELGRGAMGTVFKARDPKIDRVVAVKTITVSGVSPQQEEEYRKRFFREAQAAGKLSHPGIVTIHDIGEDPATGTPFIVMEFIAGQTLERWLTDASQTAPTVEQSLRLVKQIAEALDYAHSEHIVHRDIKPANIMLIGNEHRPKIADFGIAKLTQSDFTAAGDVLGTPSFMSPEQLNGGVVDGRSDIFSMGVILYWMLTGEKPFTGATSTVLFQVACQNPVPPTRRNALLSPEHDYIVDRALAKDPELRYKTAGELAVDLEDLLEGRSPTSQSARNEAQAERTLVQQAPALPVSTINFGTAPPLAYTEELISTARHLWTAGKEAAQKLSPHAAALKSRFDGLPRKMRAGVLVAIVALVAVPMTYKLARAAIIRAQPSVPLEVRVSHTLRSAELSVWADDYLVLEGKLTGATRRQMFRTTVQGSFAETASVPAGKRVIRVRVSSPEDGFDQSKELEGEFTKDKKPALIINAIGESLNITLRD